MELIVMDDFPSDYQLSKAYDFLRSSGIDLKKLVSETPFKEIQVDLWAANFRFFI